MSVRRGVCATVFLVALTAITSRLRCWCNHVPTPRKPAHPPCCGGQDHTPIPPAAPGCGHEPAADCCAAADLFADSDRGEVVAPDGPTSAAVAELPGTYLTRVPSDSAGHDPPDPRRLAAGPIYLKHRSLLL